MKFFHTMVRITDIEESLDFYCDKLGLHEVRRIESETGRYTNIFLASMDDHLDYVAEANKPSPKLHDYTASLELTFNWPNEDGSKQEAYTNGRNFGHLAFRVTDIYATCQRLIDNGVTINRPPRDGKMAFIKSPDGISIELLQNGDALPPQEPWVSMDNIGTW